MHSKYAIVGAGLMGRLLAVALAQRGAQVDLFDQGGSDASGAAARIAAAMLAPLAESAITEDSQIDLYKAYIYLVKVNSIIVNY